MLSRLRPWIALLVIVMAGGAPGSAAAQSGPIKVGLLVPLTGAASALGKDMLNGTELYLDEINHQAANRRIELVVEDTEGVTATALTKARKLVDQDHVAILKYKKIVTIGFDYAFGWETVGGFQRTFEEHGGQIIQKIWTPLNTADFSPFIAQVKPGADAVFAVFFGRGSLQFVKQYAESGLKAKVPLIGNGTLTDESVLPQMGDEALGVYTALHYSAALDNPANKAYAKAFEAKAGKVPSYYAETCYTNMRWIVEAIRAINGKVEDRDAVLAALKKVELKDFPRGPVVIDKWG